MGSASSVWVDTGMFLASPHDGHLQREQLDLQWESGCHRALSGSFLGRTERG